MENFSWNYFWEIIKDIVMPHLGRFVFNILIFTALGLLIAIVLLVVMGKKKVLTRANKIYNIIVKVVYIPLIVITSLYVFSVIGMSTGIYRIFSVESPRIINGIYDLTIDKIFSTEEDKEVFLIKMKDIIGKAKEKNEEFSNQLKDNLSQKMSNKNIDRFSNYIVDKYNEQIYSAVLYGLFYATDIKFDKKLNYSDFENVLDILMKIKVVKIEKSIKFTLTDKLQRLFNSQYYSLISAKLMIWFFLIAIPFVEFIIYKVWIEKKIIDKATK